MSADADKAARDQHEWKAEAVSRRAVGLVKTTTFVKTRTVSNRTVYNLLDAFARLQTVVNAMRRHRQFTQFVTPT